MDEDTTDKIYGDEGDIDGALLENALDDEEEVPAVLADDLLADDPLAAIAKDADEEEEEGE